MTNYRAPQVRYASPMPNPMIDTPRLRLSPLLPDDAAFILELLNEPAFLRDIGDKQVRSLEDARAYIETGPRTSYRDHGFGLLRVELQSTGEPIGICGLLKREFLEHPDLGYALLERHWSKGYAFEAASAIMGYAAEKLKLDLVLAITAPENPTSIRVLEKLGFRFDRLANFPGYTTSSRVFVWAK
jgi:[ribosomal protein S5]-alanine N-acetyltransferase